MRAKTSRITADGLQPYEWVSMRSIEVARRLNHRCLTLLGRVGNSRDSACDLEVVTSHIELWRRFDVRACERAARVPIVLLDCHFSDVGWWRRLITEGQPPSSKSRKASCFPIGEAAPLLREIIVEVRTIAITEPRAASMIVGAPADVVAIVAELTSTNIDELSLACAPELRPRWEENLIFWKNLLEASIGNSEDALSLVNFHSLQLLGSMLMIRRPTGAKRHTRIKPT